MIVDVNKAGADDLVLGVDLGLRLAGGQPAHRGNTALSNPHIGAKPRIANAVYHTAVADYEVKSHYSHFVLDGQMTLVRCQSR